MKKELKTQLTKKKIIDAAMTEFSRNGYENGSVNEICKSGINKGLIYHNYKNKDEIYLECVEKSCISFLELMKEKLTEADLSQYLKIRHEYSLRPESNIFFEALLNPPVHLHQEIQTILDPFYRHREEILNDILSLMPLRDGWTQEEAYRYFSITIDGYNELFARRRMQNIESNVETHENDVARLIDALLYGIVQQNNP